MPAPTLTAAAMSAIDEPDRSTGRARCRGWPSRPEGSGKVTCRSIQASWRRSSLASVGPGRVVPLTCHHDECSSRSAGPDQEGRSTVPSESLRSVIDRWIASCPIFRNSARSTTDDTLSRSTKRLVKKSPSCCFHRQDHLAHGLIRPVRARFGRSPRRAPSRRSRAPRQSASGAGRIRQERRGLVLHRRRPPSRSRPC